MLSEVKWLLGARADAEKPVEADLTPLRLAARFGNDEVVDAWPITGLGSVVCTPWKFNIDPENSKLPKGNSSSNHDFSGSRVKLQGCFSPSMSHEFRPFGRGPAT